MNKYYISGYAGIGSQYMLYECENKQDITLVNGEPKENLIKRMSDYFFSLQKRIQKTDKIYQFYDYQLNDINFSQDYENYLIFFNSQLNCGYPIGFFTNLKKKNPTLKLILYIVDAIELRVGAISLKYKDEFDVVYSIIKQDCEKYHFTYFPLVFSKVDDLPKQKTVVNDLYFVGGGQRTEELKDILNQAKKYGVICDLYAVNEIIYETGGIHYIQGMEYMDNLQHISNSNCILEIMHQGVENITQRYCEAVCYNKKLLTNNKNVIHTDYYKPEYIQVFERIEDIDWNWITKREEVDYGYKGEWSPLNFLTEIEHHFAGK